MKPDPIHEKKLATVLGLEPSEIKRRLEISDYKDSEYIASEVLTSLIRRRFGKNTGVLGLVVEELHSRLTTLIKCYFFKKNEWYKVVSLSSETLKEAVSYAWERLCADANAVSLAEVKFLPWVECRAIDYLKDKRGRIYFKEAKKMRPLLALTLFFL